MAESTDISLTDISLTDQEIKPVITNIKETHEIVKLTFDLIESGAMSYDKMIESTGRLVKVTEIHVAATGRLAKKQSIYVSEMIEAIDELVIVVDKLVKLASKPFVKPDILRAYAEFTYNLYIKKSE